MESSSGLDAYCTWSSRADDEKVVDIVIFGPNTLQILRHGSKRRHTSFPMDEILILNLSDSRTILYLHQIIALRVGRMTGMRVQFRLIRSEMLVGWLVGQG